VASQSKPGFFPAAVFLLIITNMLVYRFNTATFSFPALWTNPLSLITYQFGHVGIEHLMGNMMFLLFAGPVVEKRLGSLKFLALYLVSGIFSALGYGMFYQNSELVGASGAISGVLAVYPFVQSTLPGLLISGLLLGFYFLQNFMASIVALLMPTGVATLAHVAGGVTGLLMFCLFKRK
jgi:membrane associated rhomboid family serine protease